MTGTAAQLHLFSIWRREYQVYLRYTAMFNAGHLAGSLQDFHRQGDTGGQGLRVKSGGSCLHDAFDSL